MGFNSVFKGLMCWPGPADCGRQLALRSYSSLC